MSTPEYDDLEAEFGEVMGLLREGPVEAPDERPSEAVWDAIAGELDLTGRIDRTPAPVLPPEQLDAVVGGPSSTDDAVSADDRLPSSDRLPSDDMSPVEERGAVVRDIGAARSWGRRTAILTAVAAALLLVAIPVGLALTGGFDPDLQAELAALEGFDGSGEAEIDGRDLRVRFDGSEAPDGSFYELWLLDFEGEELVDLESLGEVEVAEDGSFVLPDDIDLDRFDVVDVSIEPDDGDPTHSGASILRGGLTRA